MDLIKTIINSSYGITMKRYVVNLYDRDINEYKAIIVKAENEKIACIKCNDYLPLHIKIVSVYEILYELTI